MSVKLAEITACSNCPFEGWDTTCTKNGRSLDGVYELPEWCPLPDAKTNERGIEMKTYVGCKIIQAKPMDHEVFLLEKSMKENGFLPHSEIRKSEEGYRVLYPDGYVSWSPKATFETAYREVTEGEINFLTQARNVVTSPKKLDCIGIIDNEAGSVMGKVSG